MEQSQLVELIRLLKPEEKEHVLEFSTLHFFNVGRMRERVITLLSICLDHPWHLNEQKLEKMEVSQLVFPGENYVEGKLEKVMVEAHKVVRSFLLSQRYFREENEFSQILDFSEIAREKGLEIRYRQLMTRLEKMQDTSPFENRQFFQQHFALEFAKCDEATVRNQAKGDLNIPNTLFALELDYLLKRLELLNQFLVQQKLTTLEVPAYFRPLFADLDIPSKYLEDYPVLKITYEIYLLLKKTELLPSDVENLFDLLLRYEQKFDPKSLREYYGYLRNICILTLTADFDRVEIDYILQKLYRDNLERGYMHYEGKINRTRYWAIASNATRIKDYQWALEFIERYKDEIRDENETKDIYRLNMASYLFAVGQFSECLDNIPPTSPFVDYLLHGKRLELKALFELRSDLFSYKLDAFKMFLSRTSQKLLSENQRKTHSDFANFLTQITSSIPGDAKRSEIIFNRIYEKKHVVEWRWLLEKAKELKR